MPDLTIKQRNAIAREGHSQTCLVKEINIHTYKSQFNPLQK